MVIKMKQYNETDIMERLRELDTTLLCDGSAENISMDQRIKPISDDYLIVGPAFTVRSKAGDSKAVSKALEMAGPGVVIVVDADGTDYNAVWGDVKSLIAQVKGIEGVVIDGSARDLKDCRKVGFPVFSKYIVSRASRKEHEGEQNVPVICGGLEVNPGDIIVGDANGVVAIRPDRLEEVIQKADAKKLKVEGLIEKIRRGEIEDYL